MISVTGKRIHEMLKDLQEKYGAFHMHEENLALTEEEESSLKRRLFEEKEVPHLSEAVKTVSYQDGLKLYFENGGWLVARFSGTEKLVRVFTEMATLREAKQIATEFMGHFGIDG